MAKGCYRDLRDALGGGSQYRGRRQAAEFAALPAGARIPLG